MKILVIGGQGFYGARVLAAIAALGEPVEVAAGGRRGPVTIDLTRPETFPAMADFALVVNSSDAVNAPPDAAMAWCLARGIVWLDMGADAPTVERLLAVESQGGTAMVGVGVFPGLSTALAASVVIAACGGSFTCADFAPTPERRLATSSLSATMSPGVGPLIAPPRPPLSSAPFRRLVI